MVVSVPGRALGNPPKELDLMSEASEPIAPKPRRGVRTGLKVALVSAGIAAGAVGATALGASAATSTSGSATTGAATAAYSVSGGSTAPTGGGTYHVPELSGTVTAVGSGTVTIKTSSATTTYTVTSASDIDKNGEARLSDLVAGDAVTFNVMPNSATTINKLHAGDEAKDRPAAPANTGTSG
jgi:hypothetical protein